MSATSSTADIATSLAEKLAEPVVHSSDTAQRSTCTLHLNGGCDATDEGQNSQEIDVASDGLQQNCATIVKDMPRLVREHLLHGTEANPRSMSDTFLQAWLAQVQCQTKEAAQAQALAKEMYKRVDEERASAREEYRRRHSNAACQQAWRLKVHDAKKAQAALRQTREAYRRASAAVEAIIAETKVRAGDMALGGIGTNLASMKRKRKQAPEEECPYCEHTYTVRDGLSTKVGGDGTRLHLRKCQCREKTPPCRNCPKCKAIADLMIVTDTKEQQSMCQLKIKCEICSCKCPGAGKWVEKDQFSRESYERRTAVRNSQLQSLGWNTSAKISFSFSENEMFHQDLCDIECSLAHQHQYKQRNPRHVYSIQASRHRALRRLPQDIRHQLETLQGTHKLQQEATTVQQPAATMQRKDSHTLSSTKSYSRQAGRLQQQAQQLALDRAGMADAKQGSSSAKESYLQPPNMTSKASVQHMPPAALPPLPPEVVLLIDEVFTFAAGPSAATAVRDFLQSQRVTSLDDFNYLELPWLQATLEPAGLTPLLLNKFLAVGRRRSAEGKLAQHPNNDV